MKSKSRKTRRLSLIFIAALLLAMLVPVALAVGRQAGSPQPPAHHQEVVAADGAETVRMIIDIPEGVLDLDGGSGALLDADFHYSESASRPAVYYKRQGDQGTVFIQQPAPRQTGLQRTVNRWQLHLDEQMPLDLMVNAGVGVHALNLQGLTLRSAAIAVPDRGVMAINLGGFWREDVDVRIQGGAGLLVITLPQGMGARVELAGPPGKVTAEGLGHPDNEAALYVNEAFRQAAPAVRVTIAGQQGEVTLKTGVPADLPVAEALKLARLIYSQQGTFNCAATPDDGRYLPGDTVRDLWYDYLCERGPQQRIFDGDDRLTQELATAEMVDRIRRDYYRTQTDVHEATMKFNTGEFMSATLDMLLKARSRPQNIEFSLTHFMGSFTYSVQRKGDRLHFTVENQTDLASGTHLPLRFPDAGYTVSLETLVEQQPQLAGAYLLELVQSNRYPILSILEAKTREETQNSMNEGGGNMHQTFTWSEPYLDEFATLPPWPDYVRQLDIR